MPPVASALTIARRPAAESETLACCATCSSCCRSAGVTITWIRSTLRACVAAIVRLPASPPELLKQFAGCCPAPRSRRAYSRDDDPHEPDPVEVVAPGPVCGNRPARQQYGHVGLKTPRPTWNPDIDSPIKFFEGWQRAPDYQLYDNAFKIQWEMFLRHVVKNEPWRFSLLEGAKGVQLAEKGLESWEKRCWVDLPTLAP